MKSITVKSLILATGILLASSVSSRAALGDDTDWLLGFRASAGNGIGTNVVIDLGNYESLKSYGVGLPALTFDFKSSTSVLSLAYGTNWYTRSDIFWGVVGVDYNKLETYIGGVTTPVSLIDISSVIDNYGALIPAITSGNCTQTNVIAGNALSFNATIAASGNGSSWTKVISGVNGEGAFNNTFSGTLDYSITSRTNINVNHVWTDFDYVNNVGGSVAYTPYLAGKVSIANGIISVVPEPSTYALFATAGLVAFIYLRRRKTA